MGANGLSLAKGSCFETASSFRWRAAAWLFSEISSTQSSPILSTRYIAPVLQSLNLSPSLITVPCSRKKISQPSDENVFCFRHKYNINPLCRMSNFFLSPDSRSWRGGILPRRRPWRASTFPEHQQRQRQDNRRKLPAGLTQPVPKRCFFDCSDSWRSYNACSSIAGSCSRVTSILNAWRNLA